ncbi:uncharacterized protein PRCAT00003975001 [Priceomyces carsonii]|uniref:uncharacterized protein n=1 Tax=Priceomyces carsonii TaxID=28549 RepID=UPI002ED77DD0|nr:unnamed protein product [Priceomyces carsonii]
MDGTKKESNSLKTIPTFGITKTDISQLSSKDRRYIQQVEKALSSFESLEEWADYIAFLSRLQKALQLSDDKRLHHTVAWIPQAAQVAKKLSLCLSSKLPNGVHQKTLTIYESIFNALTKQAFNETLDIWLLGLLPVLSFCSIQVKPQLLAIYKKHLLVDITSANLNVISRPIILSLLPGLEDETSEVFGDVLSILDTFKIKLGNDSHFWQSMFLSIIENPEKRLGALCWCNKRLPDFTSIKISEKNKLSDEAQACLDPESGLLIRLFATSVNTVTHFNPANDIIVIRGFLDLLTSRLTLNSDVLNELITTKDKELLLMACCKVTLKKDMSLNRRLWNWLLGPDHDPTLLETPNQLARAKYFESYGLQSITSGLLKMMEGHSISEKQEGLKISLSLIIDKWEISHLITPLIFSPILRACYENKNEPEIISSAQAFFDGVETSYIWNDINTIILDGEDDKLDFLEFVLRTFNFNEEEIIVEHVPLSILSLLVGRHVTYKTLDILEILISFVPQKSFASIDENPPTEIPSREELEKDIKSYYSAAIRQETAKFRFEENLPTQLLSALQRFYINNINDVRFSRRIGGMYCDVLNMVSKDDLGISWYNDIALTMLNHSIITKLSTEEEKQSNLLTTLTITKVFNLIHKHLSLIDKSKILRIILTNLWTALISSLPTNHQVESVKAIFDLRISCPGDHIEAGIMHLLLESSRHTRVRAFLALWTHSSSFADGDSILKKPLLLLLDDLHDADSYYYTPIHSFVNHVIVSGSANRLLKLITSPLLGFTFLNANESVLITDDDVGRFSYYLSTVADVIKTNSKLCRETFNNELAAIDDEAKVKLVHSNEWDISTYKSLVLNVIERYLNLKLSKEFLHDEECLGEYYDSVNSSLELFSILITGNEADFLKKFYFLIDSCFNYIDISEKRPFQIELVETKFLKCIFHFLKLSEDLKINLNLLHIDDESKDSRLIRFIIKGIEKAQTSILLENWMSLLTRALYLFNDSVFSVLLTLNDSIIKRIESIFNSIESTVPAVELTDVELAINVLLTGLEDLLSISHSFLMTSSIKSNADRANLQNTESGFLGNVIQGVFQIESPAVRTTEQNKLYSILISFQDAVKTSFLIWNWADSKPQSNEHDIYSADRSLTYLAHKLRFRTRKLLSALMDLERQEVIETLIESSTNINSCIKLLNVLDGGRSQITLPHLLNSITSRCYPQLLGDKQKSSLNIPIDSRRLSHFLASYFESVDADTMTDIWAPLTQFLKEVLAHTSQFKETLPDLLKVVKTLSLKINSSKIVDQRKKKRESSEIFVKLLTSAVSDRIVGLPSEEGLNDNKEDNTQNSETLMSQDDLLETLSVILEDLAQILQDDDKVTHVINVIVAKLAASRIRPKKINEVSFKTLTLLHLIGQYQPTKSWRSLVYDSFLDNSFFSCNSNKLGYWQPVIGTWIGLEKDKFSDLTNKVSPPVSSTSANIFNWSESLEVELKVFTIRRLSYLMMIKPKDFFLNNIDELFDRIEYSFGVSCPPIYKAEIFTLLRVLTFKFSELHLLPRWTTITHELMQIFEYVLLKNSKELYALDESELKLILSSCKLLDQLLLLGYDDFNLNEWLFVTSNPDVARGESKSFLYSVIDRIANEKPLTNLKDDPIKVDAPSGALVPLLSGVKTIESVSNLRLFFDSLSVINYERIFGLYRIDYDACESDILNDLMT